MWRFAVLEIYRPMGFHADGEVYTAPWPTKGTPADWIEQKLVGYRDGDMRDFVSFIPFWIIVAWKIRHILRLD